MDRRVAIFLHYAHKDRVWLNELILHLMPMLRLGLIDLRYDVSISPGASWEEEINKYLEMAQIILLLVSPDFMASDYCYGEGMVRAMERHVGGEALVIPVLLRPIYWQGSPFGKLKALPMDAQPVTKWPDRDDAFFNIAEGIREVVEKIIASWG